MEVILAETAGFCMGVDMALNKLDSLIEKGTEHGGKIFILGPIIHNPQVLERYARKGVVIAKSPEDIPSGSAAVIRAHGVPKSVEQDLRDSGVQVLDATCPRVKKAQLIIEKEFQNGRKLLLYGEKEHPEVRGLLSYAGSGALLFGTKEEIENHHFKKGEKYSLAAQTTQEREVFKSIAKSLQEREDCDVSVLETICDATRLRQEEAVRIARQVDFMVVVGGYNSGNTRRLAQVAESQNTPCIHVETGQELPLEELKKYKKIGLTAGASTPRDLVENIYDTLKAL